MSPAGKLLSMLNSLARSRLRRNMVLASGQGLVGMVAMFVTYRMLVDATGVETLGLWSLTVGIVAFARIADVSGGSGLNRLVAVATQDARAAPMIDTVTLFSLALYGALALVLVVPLQELIVLNVTAEHHELARALVLWALGVLIATVLSTSQLSALDGMHRADIRAGLQIAGAVVLVAGAAVLIPRQGAIGLAVARLLQLAVMGIGARFVLTRLVPGLAALPLRFSGHAFREAFGYGLRLQAAGIAQLVGDPGARLVVNHFGGLAGLAAYDVAQRLANYAAAMVTAATLPLVPEFSRSHELDRPARDALYARVMRVSIPVVGAFYAALCLAGLAAGWFILGALPVDYLAHLGLLSAGWFAFAVATPSLLLARGAGVLRWNIAGQWTIALGAIGLGGLAGLADAPVSLGVAAALAAGAWLQLAGNARFYGLPLPWQLADWRSVPAIAVFCAVDGAILVAASML